MIEPIEPSRTANDVTSPVRKTDLVQAERSFALRVATASIDSARDPFPTTVPSAHHFTAAIALDTWSRTLSNTRSPDEYARIRHQPVID